MTTHAAGVPSWVALSSPEPAASEAFYSELLGWTATPPAPEMGNYQRFLLDGKAVAGLQPLMAPEEPPTWTTYIATDDADATHARIVEAGGTPFFDVMDVMDLGRMGVYADPTGPVFGTWEAGSFAGAEVRDAPNALCWNEALTGDAETARAFYRAVFPTWEPVAPTFEGAPSDYTIWEVGGQPVAGLMQLDPEHLPADTPPAWGVCFYVLDADAVAATATELGGSIVMGPMDMAGLGRFVAIADPHGDEITVMQPEPGARG